MAGDPSTTAPLLRHAKPLGNSDLSCPKCTESLARFQVYGVEIDICNKCQGTWCDKGELRQLKDRCDKGSWGDLRWIDDELEAIETLKGSLSTFLCPRCKEIKLYSIVFPHSSISIDVCKNCHGVWLDSGEFAQIIENLRAKLNKITSKEMREKVVEEVKEIWSGPENVFSELLDAKVAISALLNIAVYEHPKFAVFLINLEKTLPKL